MLKLHYYILIRQLRIAKTCGESTYHEQQYIIIGLTQLLNAIFRHEGIMPVN